MGKNIACDKEIARCRFQDKLEQDSPFDNFGGNGKILVNQRCLYGGKKGYWSADEG